MRCYAKRSHKISHARRLHYYKFAELVKMELPLDAYKVQILKNRTVKLKLCGVLHAGIYDFDDVHEICKLLN